MTSAGCARGGLMKKIAGKAANAKRNAVTNIGGASPTPTLMAMKVIPQTTAASTAVNVSRGLMTAFVRLVGLRLGFRRGATSFQNFHRDHRALIEQQHWQR